MRLRLLVYRVYLDTRDIDIAWINRYTTASKRFDLSRTDLRCNMERRPSGPQKLWGLALRPCRCAHHRTTPLCKSSAPPNSPAAGAMDFPWRMPAYAGSFRCALILQSPECRAESGDWA